jgi:iron complex transport system substrate-binding protein
MNPRNAGLVAVALAIALWVWLSASVHEPAAPEHAGAPLASRVVSLDPGITETIIALAATDRLVARPDHSEHWPEVAALPSVGTGLTPNYEGIVRAHPDLILTSGSRGAVLSDLQSIAPTRALPWLTVADVAAGIRVIGELLGRKAPGELLAMQIQDGLRDRVSADSPSVLLLIGGPSEANPDLFYIKADSLHGAALAAGGGRNAIQQKVRGMPSISIERLLDIDPDVILIMLADDEASEGDLARHRRFWSRLDMLSAVQNERVDFLIGTHLFFIGPGILELAEAVRSKVEAIGG